MTVWWGGWRDGSRFITWKRFFLEAEFQWLFGKDLCSGKSQLIHLWNWTLDNYPAFLTFTTDWLDRSGFIWERWWVQLKCDHSERGRNHTRAKIFMSVQELVIQYLTIRHKLKTKQCIFSGNTHLMEHVLIWYCGSRSFTHKNQYTNWWKENLPWAIRK